MFDADGNEIPLDEVERDEADGYEHDDEDHDGATDGGDETGMNSYEKSFRSGARNRFVIDVDGAHHGVNWTKVMSRMAVPNGLTPSNLT